MGSISKLKEISFSLDLFTPTPALEPDVKVDGAIAGICGFYNFANTCYMNSGLQCLLATPTFVKYFTESFESSKDDTIALGLTAKFQVYNAIIYTYIIFQYTKNKFIFQKRKSQLFVYLIFI